jgi:hypothetical protein
MTLTTDAVREMLSQPEGAHLEFKLGNSILKNAAHLAPTVAGFANADGGVVLFGHGGRFVRARFGEETPGVDDVSAALRGIDRVLSEVSLRPDAEVSVHEIDGKKLIALEIKRGKHAPYLGAGSAVRRAGDRLVPLSVEELERHISSGGHDETRKMLDGLLRAVTEQSALIAVLRRELAAATSAKRQWQYGLVFVLIGALVSVATALLLGG